MPSALCAGANIRLRTDISATLFLSDPAEYDGGELVDRGHLRQQSVKLPAGHMVLYPATSLHRVTPVTRGTRWASFFWVQSMVKDDGKRRELFELDRAIHGNAAALGDTHHAVGRADRRLSQSFTPMERVMSATGTGLSTNLSPRRCCSGFISGSALPSACLSRFSASPEAFWSMSSAINDFFSPRPTATASGAMQSPQADHRRRRRKRATGLTATSLSLPQEAGDPAVVRLTERGAGRGGPRGPNYQALIDPVSLAGAGFARRCALGVHGLGA